MNMRRNAIAADMLIQLAFRKGISIKTGVKIADVTIAFEEGKCFNQVMNFFQ